MKQSCSKLILPLFLLISVPPPLAGAATQLPPISSIALVAVPSAATVTEQLTIENSNVNRLRSWTNMAISASGQAVKKKM
jgi:hypothetical protein